MKVPAAPRPALGVLPAAPRPTRLRAAQHRVRAASRQQHRGQPTAGGWGPTWPLQPFRRPRSPVLVGRCSGLHLPTKTGDLQGGVPPRRARPGRIAAATGRESRLLTPLIRAEHRLNAWKITILGIPLAVRARIAAMWVTAMRARQPSARLRRQRTRSNQGWRPPICALGSATRPVIRKLYDRTQCRRHGRRGEAT